jgi:hypothetical protein
MVEEDIIRDMQHAQRYLLESNASIVAIKDQRILGERKGFGLRPFLELIDEMGLGLSECVVGDRILGRASSLLCHYSKVRGVYSPTGTKTAIALLIMGGIACQVDSIVPFITNIDGDDMCPFEELLQAIDDPQQAYELLYEKLMQQ